MWASRDVYSIVPSWACQDKISVFSALKYILPFIMEVFTNIRMPCLLPFFHQAGTVDARHLDAISKQGQNQQGRGGFPLYDRIPITNFEP